MTTPSGQTSGATGSATGAAPSVSVPQQRRGETEQPTGWYGWVVFGAIMMGMAGAFHAIAGLVALFDDGYYLVRESGLVVSVDYTTWGWVHLGLGVLLVAASVSLISGRMWARVVGVAVASLSAVVNLAFLAAYPLWATLMITLAVLVIYAIVVHGKEGRALSA
jgi:hypothetical protein